MCFKVAIITINASISNVGCFISRIIVNSLMSMPASEDFFVACRERKYVERIALAAEDDGVAHEESEDNEGIEQTEENTNVRSVSIGVQTCAGMEIDLIDLLS